MTEGAFALVITLEGHATWLPMLVTTAIVFVSTICLCSWFFSRQNAVKLILGKRFSTVEDVAVSAPASPATDSATAAPVTEVGAKAKDTNATEGNVMEALPHESLEYEGLAEEALAQEALDQQWADEMDFWMYPGTPKSVRLNRMYRDNGIDYNANLLQRYNQFGMAGLSVLERSEDYEFRSAFAEIEERVAEHQLFLSAAEGSNSRDRHGSSQRLLRHFSRTELDAQVWISQQRRGYAFHRQSCSIRVSAKKWVTLEAALVQGKRPCQQCFSDYAQRLQ